MENQDGGINIKSRNETKRPSKIRDLLTDRVVGIVGGACIPLVLLFIPLANKYLDNSKEIQALQIQSNAEDIQSTNTRVTVLTQLLVNTQVQMKSLSDKLLECEKNCLNECPEVKKK